jgi:hypothetical protein
MSRGGMLFNYSLAKDIAIKSLCIAAFIPWSCASHAQEATEAHANFSQNLPDLPGADHANPGQFSVDEESVFLGYDGRFSKWGATLDEYSYLNPSLTLDYGMLLTNKFGAGATVTHHNGYSDVLINGVYAPKRNLRLRLAGGQLRTSSDFASAWGYQPSPLLQNSYLVDLKRNAGIGRLVSDFGLTAYTVRANGAGQSSRYSDFSALTDEDMPDSSEIDSDTLAARRLDGYMLNFGLQPTPYSRVELKRERTHLSYRYGDGYQGNEFRDINHVRFSQYLNNCARLQGRYSGAADSQRVDVSLAKNKWSVSVSRAVDYGVPDTAIQIGYAISLGKARSSSGDCGSQLATGRMFGSLVDATVARPIHLPREPLGEGGY